jgi:hypothetical protein
MRVKIKVAIDKNKYIYDKKEIHKKVQVINVSYIMNFNTNPNLLAKSNTRFEQLDLFLL